MQARAAAKAVRLAQERPREALCTELAAECASEMRFNPPQRLQPHNIHDILLWSACSTRI